MILSISVGVMSFMLEVYQKSVKYRLIQKIGHNMAQRENLKVVALQMANIPEYQRNMDELLAYIEQYNDNGLIVAPEVCLTDYDYKHLDEAVKFSQKALAQLLRVIDKQILVLTILDKSEDEYINDAVVIHKHKIVHRQSKYKLFALGDEDKYLKAGREEEIKLFEVDGVNYGVLICFELRFKELWARLEGADVIMIPSQWGLPRKRHLEILSQALAVVNQCYVVVANSAKETMASSSAIYSPNGGVVRDDMLPGIEGKIDFSLIKKMRRYIVMK